MILRKIRLICTAAATLLFVEYSITSGNNLQVTIKAKSPETGTLLHLVHTPEDFREGNATNDAGILNPDGTVISNPKITFTPKATGNAKVRVTSKNASETGERLLKHANGESVPYSISEKTDGSVDNHGDNDVLTHDTTSNKHFSFQHSNPFHFRVNVDDAAAAKFHHAGGEYSDTLTFHFENPS